MLKHLSLLNGFPQHHLQQDLLSNYGVDGDGKWNKPNWMGMETGKRSVNLNYDPKQCCALEIFENYSFQLFPGMQILSMWL